MNRGKVSIIEGRRQGPALRVVTVVAWLLASLGLLGDGGPFQVLGIAALILVMATPLLRVGWLIYRWWQERDFRFVWIAFGLLAAVAVGGAIALFV